VAIARLKDQDGADTALTEMCFSRLGTGPMWPFMRVGVVSRDLTYAIILIESYSKFCSSMRLTLPTCVVTIYSIG
jgi:hypothetical protein